MIHRNGTENVTVPSIISKGLFPSKSFPVAKIFSLLRSIFIFMSALANLSILIFLQVPAVFACNDNAVFPAFLKTYFPSQMIFHLPEFGLQVFIRSIAWSFVFRRKDLETKLHRSKQSFCMIEYCYTHMFIIFLIKCI